MKLKPPARSSLSRKSRRRSIIQTFLAKLNSYGATKFLADGTVQGSDGSSGTWKAFDLEHHIYTVTIGGLELVGEVSSR